MYLRQPIKATFLGQRATKSSKDKEIITLLLSEGRRYPSLTLEAERKLYELAHPLLSRLYKTSINDVTPYINDVLEGLLPILGLTGCYEIPSDENLYISQFFPDSSFYEALASNLLANNNTAFNNTVATYRESIALKNLRNNLTYYKRHLLITMYSIIINPINIRVITSGEKSLIRTALADIKKPENFGNTNIETNSIEMAKRLYAKLKPHAQQGVVADPAGPLPILTQKLKATAELVTRLDASNESRQDTLNNFQQGFDIEKNILTQSNRSGVDTVANFAKMFQEDPKLRVKGQLLCQQITEILRTHTRLKEAGKNGYPGVDSSPKRTSVV